MRRSFPVQGEAGFTFAEMMIVMAVFITVIVIASDTFKTILTTSGMLTKSAESNIEGIVGLEMLRHDLAQVGFGLPTSFVEETPPVYAEASNAPENSYNDAGKTDPTPRGIVAGNNLTSDVLDKTDYLVLKGSDLARNETAQRWTYVTEEGGTIKDWPTGANLEDDDRVIVLRRTVVNEKFLAQLVHQGNTFSTKYKKAGLDAPFTPTIPGDIYFIYGISPDQTPRMPFNRVDYYVKRPASMPASCAPNTGILYKATLNHGTEDGKSGGTLFPMPVLDCVADMQVVLGWDLDADGAIDAYSDADGTTLNGGSGTAPVDDAEKIREQLKVIKVYLLVQDGRRDPNYSNLSPIIVGDAGEKSLTKEYDVNDITDKGWQHYRWKVYRIVVNPKNLKTFQKS